MKRLFLCLLAFSFLFTAARGLCVSAEPGVSAESAILLDAADGTVLFERSADRQLAMASTTKIMTAILVLESADETEILSIPREAVGIEGSSAYLYEGEAMRVRDLLFALMLQSANDAAVALALHVSGSIEAFAGLMNEKARSLGMTNSSFVNPHGLPAEGHYSTARDMARLMQYALENPTFVSISGAKNHTTEELPGATVHYFRNHNRLLMQYEKCISGKTGYTKAAGRCLVTAAEQNGARLVCVTLSAPDDWNDHTSLFEYGFSQYQSHTLAEAEALSYSLPVVGGKTDTVQVTNLESVCLTLRDAENIDVCYELDHFVYAPVIGLDSLPPDAPAPGDGLVAGYAVFIKNSREIARVKLYYETTVAEYIPPTVWERILQFFGWNLSESKSS